MEEHPGDNSCAPLQPSAYYAARGVEPYINAMGGPYMAGGVQGISLVEVVWKVMMAIDIARVTKNIINIIISDLSQYYDNIPQDVRSTVGAAMGLGTEEELQRLTQGYRAVMPLGVYKIAPMEMGRGVPQGSVQGSRTAITAAIPGISLINALYGMSTPEPMGAPAHMWVDDTTIVL